VSIQFPPAKADRFANRPLSKRLCKKPKIPAEAGQAQRTNSGPRGERIARCRDHGMRRNADGGVFYEVVTID
jgi:hypothetical protein